MKYHNIPLIDGVLYANINLILDLNVYLIFVNTLCNLGYSAIVTVRAIICCLLELHSLSNSVM